MARMPPAERASFPRIARALTGLRAVGVAMILTGAVGRLALWVDVRWG